MLANGSLPLGGVFTGLLEAALDANTMVAVAGVVSAFADALIAPMFGRFRLAEKEIADLTLRNEKSRLTVRRACLRSTTYV